MAMDLPRLGDLCQHGIFRLAGLVAVSSNRVCLSTARHLSFGLGDCALSHCSHRLKTINHVSDTQLPFWPLDPFGHRNRNQYRRCDYSFYRDLEFHYVTDIASCGDLPFVPLTPCMLAQTSLYSGNPALDHDFTCSIGVSICNIRIYYSHFSRGIK